ncbi:MAG: tRNA-dihydrouridine synthase family protein [Treponema sp.]
MIKLIAGPMATLSHQGLRKIIEGFGGCDEYYTEMINAASYLTHGQFESFYTLNEFAPGKIVWQLTGKDVNSMAKAAKELCAFNGLGIDLNMGCSAPEIYKSGAGIAWMSKPVEQTKALVCEVKNAILSYNSEVQSDGHHKNQRLSVKLRLGDEDFTDDGFYKFCDMLYESGVEQIVLHPRTKKEKLARPPRYEYVETLASRFKNKIPVILNGNVKDCLSFNEALKKAPDASGVMIARMSAQKPWIFAELKRNLEFSNSAIRENSMPSDRMKIDRLQTGLDYIANLRLYQPKEFWQTRMQRFFAYYCDNFSYAHYIKSKMLNCKTLEDAETSFALYFDEVPGDRFIEI